MKSFLQFLSPVTHPLAPAVVVSTVAELASNVYLVASSLMQYQSVDVVHEEGRAHPEKRMKVQDAETE